MMGEQLLLLSYSTESIVIWC